MEEENEAKVRFTKTCICGNDLEAAYSSEFGHAFWNCFACFPYFEAANEKQSRELAEITAKHFI